MHRANGSVGTLGLWEVEDPTRFGIVGLDEHHKITRFMEKPKPEDVFSHLINAGSYIFNDDVFDWMPQGRHSIERDVFPQLAAEGLLSGVPFEGYFIDAGTPDAWTEAVKASIEHQRFNSGHVRGSKPSWFATQEVQDGVLPGATVDHSMVSEGCQIGQSSVSMSTLLKGAHVGDKAHIVASLIGKGARIGNECHLDGVVVDHEAVVPDGTVQHGGSWPV